MMSTIEAKLRENLDVLEKRLAQEQNTLEEVKALLAKADKRFLEAENKRRWHHVLDNLERGLDEAKARVAAFTLERDKAQAKLGALVARKEEARVEEMARRAEDTSVEERLIALQASCAGSGSLDPEDLSAVGLPRLSEKGADSILSIPLDQLRKMSLDEIATLHSDAMQEAGEEVSPPSRTSETPAPSPPDPRDRRARRLLKGKASASSTPGKGGVRGASALGERIRQSTLRAGMEKLSRGHVRLMSIEEIDAVIDSYASLSKQVESPECGAEKREHLTAVLRKIEERCSDMRRRRAQLYTRRH